MMNQKVTFQKGEYNLYYLVRLSEMTLLNFIAKLVVSAGSGWIKQKLHKESCEPIRVAGHKVFFDQSDILSIYEAAQCDELDCCDQDINKEKMEFSKAHLLALFDEWDNIHDTKPEFIELSKVTHTNKLEWISLGSDFTHGLYKNHITTHMSFYCLCCNHEMHRQNESQ